MCVPGLEDSTSFCPHRIVSGGERRQALCLSSHQDTNSHVPMSVLKRALKLLSY